MQAHIFQALTLTVFGNEYLRDVKCRALTSEAAAFRFSRETKFVEGPPTKDHLNARLAPDPNRWFAWLKNEGVKTIRLHHIASRGAAEDYNTAVFGGGGRWLIETATATQSDFWQSRSEVVEQKAPDQRIWVDTFYRVARKWQSRPEAFVDLYKARRGLADILPRIFSFAKAHEEKAAFAEHFRRGIAVLDGASPLELGNASDFEHSPSLPLEAKQLLGAAEASWVFGGMGWWNDGGLRDPEVNKLYRALTQQLWDALTHAIVAAANASAAP